MSDITTNNTTSKQPNCISGVMVSVLASSAVDRGFIGGVMVSVLAWSAVDRGFEPQSVQTKHYKMGICCFSATNAKIGWLGIRIMCPSGAIFLPSDCCFRELVLYKSNSLCWSRTKRTSSSFHWKLNSSRHDIAENIGELALNNNHSLETTTGLSLWRC